MHKAPPLCRVVHLDDTRLVFVGQRPDDTEYYIGFRNKDDVATRLVMSPEAFDALVWLHAHWNDLPLKEAFPSGQTKMVWRLVETSGADDPA